MTQQALSWQGLECRHIPLHNICVHTKLVLQFIRIQLPWLLKSENPTEIWKGTIISTNRNGAQQKWPISVIGLFLWGLYVQRLGRFSILHYALDKNWKTNGAISPIKILKSKKITYNGYLIWILDSSSSAAHKQNEY